MVVQATEFTLLKSGNLQVGEISSRSPSIAASCFQFHSLQGWQMILKQTQPHVVVRPGRSPITVKETNQPKRKFVTIKDIRVENERRISSRKKLQNNYLIASSAKLGVSSKSVMEGEIDDQYEASANEDNDEGNGSTENRQIKENAEGQGFNEYEMSRNKRVRENKEKTISQKMMLNQKEMMLHRRKQKIKERCAVPVSLSIQENDESVVPPDETGPKKLKRLGTNAAGSMSAYLELRKRQQTQSQPEMMQSQSPTEIFQSQTGTPSEPKPRNWKKVHEKDALLDYVMDKYIIPDEGQLWYWGDKKVQDIAKRNSNSRKELTETHTASPKSSAQIKNKMVLEKPVVDDEEPPAPPSVSQMYVKTRKRDENREYKLPADQIKTKIAEINKVLDAGGSVEDADRLVCAGTHSSSWLLGRHVQKRQSKEKLAAPTSVSNISEDRLAELTTKIDQLTNEMDQRVNQKVQESLALMLNKLAEKIPSLQVNVNDFLLEHPADNSSGSHNAHP
ncbi:hypothetical protein POM88_006874 [Heracleum sosnowskyi]|uniref:Uncharacterized protein n=1 Tax=Heracleum sosnowskyi TaxID=360622 RepID=A0AAD8J4C7_9APIA|nr:hypothetical protein POM88_006874 [Heracleum sosnowskyi]